jgi:hypothetical protein
LDVISFAWTTAALQAGHKSVTRRGWRPTYAQRFHAGDEIAAYDKARRNNGRRIGTVRLTADPLLESMAHMPRADYWREGFAWINEHPEFAPSVIFGEPAGPEAFTWAAFERMRTSASERLYTVRFEVADLLPVSNIATFLRPEIAATAKYWARYIAEDALQPALGDSVESITAALDYSIAQDLFALGSHPLRLFDRVPSAPGVEPIFDVTWSRECNDPLILNAVKEAGIEHKFDCDALRLASVKAWPGLVLAEVEGSAPTILFSCMPPEAGDEIEQNAAVVAG